MSEEQATATEQRESTRRGARWFNEPPEPHELATWFKDNVILDPELKHDRYVGGLVLIPAEERYKTVTRYGADGTPVIEQRERLTFTPYPKVETRVDYFWDLMELHEDKWVPRVRPIEQDRPEDDGAIARIQRSLPPGFFIMPVPVGENYSHFLCASFHVAIYRRPDYERAAAQANDEDDLDRILARIPPVRDGRGTKQVGMTRTNHQGNRVWADDNAIMKAETGAVGRALGFAGIFIIPGAGVATAEDMMEALTQPDTGTAPPPPRTPEEVAPPPQRTAPAEPAPPRTGAEQAEDDDTVLRDRGRELLGELKGYPKAYEAFGKWAAERKPPVTKLGDVKGAALRGVVRKIEKSIEEAKASGEQPAAAEETPAPQDSPAEEAPAAPETPQPAPEGEGTPDA